MQSSFITLRVIFISNSFEFIYNELLFSTKILNIFEYVREKSRDSNLESFWFFIRNLSKLIEV